MPTVERFPANPIIHPGLHESLGHSINGPSLIRVPEWVKHPLGRYYLYFAHHNGTTIRLAYADDLAGLWRIHVPGCLPLATTPFHTHIASPDVHVDPDRREIRLYYHGNLAASATSNSGPAAFLPAAVHAVAGDQATSVARSNDGLLFRTCPDLLGGPYFRVFHWQNRYYALAMPGQWLRSPDGLTRFESGPRIFTEAMRHSAVLRHGHTLHVVWSNAGDCPERLLYATIDLRPDWQHWQHTPPQDLLEPEFPFEGSLEPRVPSRRGISQKPVHELRDPAIFAEAGQHYLLYSVAGENGIAIAHLHLP